MSNEERDLNPDTGLNDDDLRYAPPLARMPDVADEPDEAGEPETAVEAEAAPVEIDLPVTDVTEGMDIEAALAAVSTLSDMLAEQEAAEQAVIAREEAEELARQERQARLEHPELFFPVPPMMTVRRGQLNTVVPALLLIGLGAWLTFALTTASQPAPTLLVALVPAGAAAVFLAHWLSSGRWSRGALFLALVFLLLGIVLILLMQPGTPGLTAGWPLLLVAPGIAFVITALLAYPPERRLLLPGFMLVVAGGAGLAITLGLIDASLAATLATLWPVALAAVVVIFLLPIIFRRRN